jgi:hypothetical protein
MFGSYAFGQAQLGGIATLFVVVIEPDPTASRQSITRVTVKLRPAPIVVKFTLRTATKVESLV